MGALTMVHPLLILPFIGYATYNAKDIVNLFFYGVGPTVVADPTNWWTGLWALFWLTWKYVALALLVRNWREVLKNFCRDMERIACVVQHFFGGINGLFFKQANTDNARQSEEQVPATTRREESDRPRTQNCNQARRTPPVTHSGRKLIWE